MQLDIVRTVASLVDCAQHTQNDSTTSNNPVITLSAGTGAGGKEVGKILAARLGVELYDKEIVDRMAQETHFNKRILELLDERVDGLKGAWFHSILTGQNLCKENYCRNLVNVILGISCRGGVILGRGGSFILAHLPVFRVHIIGSPARCAARIAAQENVTLSTAKKRVKKTDKVRKQYIKKLFKRDNNDPIYFDLVINSDHLSLESIADLILHAKQHVQSKPTDRNYSPFRLTR